MATKYINHSLILKLVLSTDIRISVCEQLLLSVWVILMVQITKIINCKSFYNKASVVPEAANVMDHGYCRSTETEGTLTAVICESL
jgi:hypothetical protein